MSICVNGKERKWVVRKSGYHVLMVLGIEGVVFFKHYDHKKRVMKWIGDVWIEDADGKCDGWEGKFDTWQSARKAVEMELLKRLNSVEIR
jgi:hypothetical protein